MTFFCFNIYINYYVPSIYYIIITVLYYSFNLQFNLCPTNYLLSTFVTSASRDAWKVRCGTSLLDYIKLKKGNGALRGSRVYIHGGTMPNNIARSLCWTGASPLELDPSPVLVRSCIGTYL